MKLANVGRPSEGLQRTPADANVPAIEAAAWADDRVAPLLDGTTVKKLVVARGELVNSAVG